MAIALESACKPSDSAVARKTEGEYEGAEDGARERDVLGVGEEVVGDGDRRLHATRTTAGDGAATA